MLEVQENSLKFSKFKTDIQRFLSLELCFSGSHQYLISSARVLKLQGLQLNPCTSPLVMSVKVSTIFDILYLLTVRDYCHGTPGKSISP